MTPVDMALAFLTIAFMCWNHYGSVELSWVVLLLNTYIEHLNQTVKAFRERCFIEI